MPKETVKIDEAWVKEVLTKLVLLEEKRFLLEEKMFDSQKRIIKKLDEVSMFIETLANALVDNDFLNKGIKIERKN